VHLTVFRSSRSVFDALKRHGFSRAVQGLHFRHSFWLQPAGDL